MFSRAQDIFRRQGFNWATRRIYSTPLLACDPRADCTVHTMLGAADLGMYMVGIKSLLGHYNAVRVVVHSDGSLRCKHRQILCRHIAGCRIIEPADAESAAARRLGKDSFLYRCRDLDINYRRLIDTEIHNATSKRIIMDADVLVLARPTEVIEWIERDRGGLLLGQASHTTLPPEAELSKAHVQVQFRAKLAAIAHEASLPAGFADGTTAGFYGCEEEWRLDLVERVIRACQKLRLPLEHWGSDQCIVIYLLSVAGAIRLNEDQYINFWPDQEHKLPGAHIVHFLGTNRHYHGLYRRLARRTASELTTAPISADWKRGLRTECKQAATN
jgi:hypothetical protein